MSVEEYEKMKREYKDIAFELEKVNKRIQVYATDLQIIYNPPSQYSNLSDQVAKSSEIISILASLRETNLNDNEKLERMCQMNFLQSELNELIQKEKSYNTILKEKVQE